MGLQENLILPKLDDHLRTQEKMIYMSLCLISKVLVLRGCFGIIEWIGQNVGVKILA